MATYEPSIHFFTISRPHTDSHSSDSYPYSSTSSTAGSRSPSGMTSRPTTPPSSSSGRSPHISAFKSRDNASDTDNVKGYSLDPIDVPSGSSSNHVRSSDSEFGSPEFRAKLAFPSLLSDDEDEAEDLDWTSQWKGHASVRTASATFGTGQPQQQQEHDSGSTTRRTYTSMRTTRTYRYSTPDVHATPYRSQGSSFPERPPAPSLNNATDSNTAKAYNRRTWGPSSAANHNYKAASVPSSRSQSVRGGAPAPDSLPSSSGARRTPTGGSGSSTPRGSTARNSPRPSTAPGQTGPFGNSSNFTRAHRTSLPPSFNNSGNGKEGTRDPRASRSRIPSLASLFRPDGSSAPSSSSSSGNSSTTSRSFMFPSSHSSAGSSATSISTNFAGARPDHEKKVSSSQGSRTSGSGSDPLLGPNTMLSLQAFGSQQLAQARLAAESLSGPLKPIASLAMFVTLSSMAILALASVLVASYALTMWDDLAARAKGAGVAAGEARKRVEESVRWGRGVVGTLADGAREAVEAVVAAGAVAVSSHGNAPRRSPSRSRPGRSRSKGSKKSAPASNMSARAVPLQESHEYWARRVLPTGVAEMLRESVSNFAQSHPYQYAQNSTSASDWQEEDVGLGTPSTGRDSGSASPPPFDIPSDADDELDEEPKVTNEPESSRASERRQQEQQRREKAKQEGGGGGSKSGLPPRPPLSILLPSIIVTLFFTFSRIIYLVWRDRMDPKGKGKARAY